MKRAAAVVLLVAGMVMGALTPGRVAYAGENKMVGVITHIEIAGKSAKTAVASLKDNASEKEIDIVITDDLTLDKFKDHRIVEGDEIKCKYEVKGGKNVGTYFRKTAGC